MKISQAGIDLIKRYEGFSATIYACPGGKATIGFGHVVQEHESFEGAITNEQAEEILALDLEWVERCLEKSLRIEVSQGQYDALCSLVYNIGAEAFRGSTLRWKLNQGMLREAAEEFPRWNKSRGKVLDGLVARRKAEREIFLAVEQARSLP